MDASDWDQRYRESTLLWSSGPNQWVDQYTSDLPPGRALDVAAGEGRNALWLADHGWNVVAVDFSAVAIERARELATHRSPATTQRVRWHVDDVVRNPPSGPYDLVLIVYLHLPPPQRRTVLRNAAATLAPGGTLLIVGHHADNLQHGVGGPQDPDVLYSEHDVLDDLASFPALTARTAQRVDRYLPNEPRPALDVVVDLVDTSGRIGTP